MPYQKVKGAKDALPTKVVFAAQVALPLDVLAAPEDDAKLAIIGGYLEDLTTKGEAWDRLALYGQIYFLADYWLRHNDADKRKASVNDVYLTAVDKLCQKLDCTVNVLPSKLEEYWGRYLGTHGWGGCDRPVTTGASPKIAIYLERKKAELYRLTFIRGLAYQLTWFRDPPFVLALAESASVGFDDKSGGQMFEPNWGGFALSMGRDFYMAKHRGGYSSDDFFHSSYLAGGAVMCTGSLLIEAGVVKGVKNDSGHYRPRIEHLVNVVETLKMYGVDIAQVTVKAVKYSYDPGDTAANGASVVNGTLVIKGDKLLAHKSLGKAVKGRHDNIGEHTARGLATANTEEPRIPSFGWLAYWTAAKLRFEKKTGRKKPAQTGFLGIRLASGIEDALKKCDGACMAAVDAVYTAGGTRASRKSAQDKFTAAVTEWEKACAAYLGILDAEIVKETKAGRTALVYAKELAELKASLARLAAGINGEHTEIGKKAAI
jgi:hypothetical protein